MNDWRKYLNSDLTGRLLEDGSSSVRSFTVKRILDFPDGHRDVRRARRRIMETGAVPEILAKQQSGGNWDEERRFYIGNYRSTVWQRIILACHAVAARIADSHIKTKRRMK